MWTLPRELWRSPFEGGEGPWRQPFPAEARECPACAGAGGRSLDNGIYGPGGWQRCWRCGGESKLPRVASVGSGEVAVKERELAVSVRLSGSGDRIWTCGEASAYKEGAAWWFRSSPDVGPLYCRTEREALDALLGEPLRDLRSLER